MKQNEIQNIICVDCGKYHSNDEKCNWILPAFPKTSIQKQEKFIEKMIERDKKYGY